MFGTGSEKTGQLRAQHSLQPLFHMEDKMDMVGHYHEFPDAHLGMKFIYILQLFHHHNSERGKNRSYNLASLKVRLADGRQ